MAFQYGKLKGIAYVASGSGALYTHNTGSTGLGGNLIQSASYIRTIALFNTDASVTHNTTLFIVSSGSIPAAGNAPTEPASFYKESLPANNLRLIEFAPPGLMLTSHGETLVGGCVSGSKVTAQVFGGQE